MKKENLIVSGMTCGHCEMRISKSLSELDGVGKAKASFETGLVEVYYDSKKVNETDFQRVIEDSGYTYKGILNEKKNNKKSRATLKEVLPIFLILIGLYMLVGAIFGYGFVSFLPTVSQTTPLLMLFVIGLLTSIHCIGMCGSINLAVSVGPDEHSSIKRPFLYNLGRVISYTITGAIVGGIGSVLSFNGMMQGIVILIAALFMIMMGLAMLGWLPPVLHRLIPKMPQTKLLNTKGKVPFVAGLLNGLMPCGPLQAMQLYALSTGSIFLGGLSLFIFALGTVPLVFSFGLLFNKLNGKYHTLIQRISSVLVILLAVVMLSRALALFGFDIRQQIKNNFFKSDYSSYSIAEIKDGKQYVTIKLTYAGYKPILVQKGIPVVFNIVTENVQNFGCTNSIRIPTFNLAQDLVEGDNLILFTPTKVGNITYTCWMGMVRSNIKVVANLKDIITEMEASK